MGVRSSNAESTSTASTAFDPRALVTRKPSSLPTIYEYVFTAGRVAPSDVEAHVDVSPCVVQPNLSTLLENGLVDRVERGVYAPASIAIEPASVHALGELRSETQYDICRVAAGGDEFDVPTMTARVDRSKSNVRAAVHRLAETGFLRVRRVPYENSYKRYRPTALARRSLASLDVDRYRGWDCRETVAHENGIEGTAFRTAYEIEDAHYLANAEDPWHHPERVAAALGKDETRTRRRFATMADRGLLEIAAEETKLAFSAAAKTRTLVSDLALYSLSTAHGLDFYAIANEGLLGEPFSIDALYATLVRRGSNPSTIELDRAKLALKCAGLLDGNPHSGYAFALPGAEATPDSR